MVWYVSPLSPNGDQGSVKFLSLSGLRFEIGKGVSFLKKVVLHRWGVETVWFIIRVDN